MRSLYMTAPNIKAVHAFTTRFGGVSKGIYESLNLGFNHCDDRASVFDNYGIICSALGISISDIVHSRQIHSSIVRVVDRTDCGSPGLSSIPEADGMISNSIGIALMVFTADCVPILLHDPIAGVVGAVHAGWRGTALDAAGATARKMADVFGCCPSNIRAAIGPCISKCCFETDSDVTEALSHALSEANESCSSPRGGKYMVDLKEANRLLLLRAGVTNLTVSDECTSCNGTKYWSHRRDGVNRGSQMAIIVNSRQSANSDV